MSGNIGEVNSAAERLESGQPRGSLARLDAGADARPLVSAEIVQDDDVAGLRVGERHLNRSRNEQDITGSLLLFL